MHRTRSQPATRVAIVGLGPWGLASLERLVSVAGRNRARLVVYVVEPGDPGAGVFALDTPEFLPLNTPCGQHIMFPDPSVTPRPAHAVSLYEWAVTQGYRWQGTTCRRTRSGRAITPDDFLPRRLMGEWLNWTYRQLVANHPDWVSIRHRRASALDVRATAGGEQVFLDTGEVLHVDHVVLTTGHTPDHPEPEEAGELLPYPVERLDQQIRPGEAVAVSGLGLVALDVVAALTVGRGGRFDEVDGRLRYLPSGREPLVSLYSRSGKPYAAKVMGATDPTGDYTPVICTDAAAGALRRSAEGSLACASVNFERDFMPLIAAEVRTRFYRQCVYLDTRSPERAEEVTRSLEAAWKEGRFDDAVARMAGTYGHIDVEGYLLGEAGDWVLTSTHEYEKWVRTAIDDDANEALAAEASAWKSALETIRVLRDTMRDVVEFQGLDLDSHVRFFSVMANRFKAAVAGPPVRRSLELLALMDCGLLRIPWGPAPVVEGLGGGRFRIRSSRLVEPYTAEVEHLIRGFMPEPTISRTSSPLIRHLSEQGRITPLRYGDVEVGSISLTTGAQPIGADGRVQERLWVFGSLTEGTRYFTQYVPSPNSRVRALIDAQACAVAILATSGVGADRLQEDYGLLRSAG